MDIRALRTFAACARLQHFTRAAEELSYAQSTVTAQVRALEEDLGVPLFDRVGRSVVLTPAGARLQGYAQRILALVAEAHEAVAFAGDQPTGDLEISATETLSTFRLPEVLRQYQARYPDVRLYLHPADPAGLVAQVLAGRTTAAITLDRRLAHADLEVEVLATEPVLLLAPPGHPLQGRRRVTPRDLAETRLLVTELDASYGGAFLEQLAAAGVQPDRPMEFSSVAAVKQCVRAGMGLTVLPAFACEEEVAAGQLRALPFDCPPVHVQLVWHRHRWLPPAAAALLDLTRVLLGPEDA